MTTGALIFAHNNSHIDYVRLANFAAERVQKYLNIPVSIVTSDTKWLNDRYPSHVFDQVIDVPVIETNKKDFYDGSLASKKLDWKNVTRHRAYELTPYDKTLVIDSDYIINSDILKIAFERNDVFQIYKDSFDLAGWRDTTYFQRINPYSIPFYWATAFVFQKDPIVEAFFNLVTYIKSNWSYFKMLYNMGLTVYRNDFAFSIAIHIMNGKTNGEFATALPGTMTYIQDRDLLLDIQGDSLQFLVEKKDYLGEYIAAKTTGIDVHVMNKISLCRVLDGEKNV
jgi:hypothetical protein